MRRIFPASLVGQVILIVALALFVAQAVNFALLYRERERQLLTVAAAPAAARVIDAIDRLGSGATSFPRVERVVFSQSAPVIAGQRRSDIEQRASDMLNEAGVRVLSIRAIARPYDAHQRSWRHSANPVIRDLRPPRGGLFLSVEYAKDQWVTAQTRLRRHSPRFLGWLIGQTLVLYVFVLVPLLLVGRLIARPLRDLTGAAEQFATTGAAGPVHERGPGDVRRLTTAFNAMRSRLLAMLNEKDRMLGAIGHDLRTPLASLRVRAESVEDEGERARMTETILEMNRMLDDILSLARMGRSMEEIQKVDLAALADAVVEDFVELGGDVALTECDRIIALVRPQLLKRALRNLVENALKYGEHAQVELVRDGDSIRIDVNDEGPGIAQERMAEMMEPFTRMEDSRNRDTGGAGLGLALVQAIMLEHGGELRLANRLEGGLRASLVLPLSAPES
ncbi:HAMP domain-containing sensor histidine kinase [Rhizorhapis sp. SPR117]|uniref:HAMP domain-containing sensor histidine kinase n=1 Tax=Rhizorhapis sp. SPR117 TaxID=2912611 RepID=UPI001F22E139|nr:ATP-binding protein [Rhizorhapis sp. SPR117]